MKEGGFMPVFKKSMLILLVIVLGAAMGTYYSLAEDDNEPMEKILKYSRLPKERIEELSKEIKG